MTILEIIGIIVLCLIGVCAIMFIGGMIWCMIDINRENETKDS
jgi:TRAP-type C4-dicarboxylate transport system permease small subunit